MSDFISVSLCVSDIPKALIKEANNGKKYLNISVSRMKEPDKYDQTHTAFISQTKEEREAGEPKIYIGKGKEINFTAQAVTAESINNMPAMTTENDDLPF